MSANPLPPNESFPEMEALIAHCRYCETCQPTCDRLFSLYAMGIGGEIAAVFCDIGWQRWRAMAAAV